MEATPSPDRHGAMRHVFQMAPSWWQAVMNEIDLGLCVVGRALQVVFANEVARAVLASRALGEGRLNLPDRGDQLRLEQALYEARHRGLRRLLVLNGHSGRLPVSVLPLPATEGAELALLLIGKRQLCGALPMQAFAREYQLTGAEQQVLVALCDGDAPQAIATRHGVAISTVRTQIASIRAKTSTDSIRELVALIAQLPPLQSVLRVADGA
ncbi:helix-turn-helix transcriptional regulator [Pelomonas sp. CA6]|uniref:helix-turn-helix transcriptional regulator n=1 Tax=Pelomonas sp. CA6 TaxID=2907999 RepID=UPI001F4A5145|nr:helix-turn-helix transcriptional regulator [Pelomonas sp. CA6]MCH7342296.1 helix-turn-helix transcriptional regulator [Pelomonas sp. CA6]